MTKLILGTVQFGLNYGINNSIGKPELNTVSEILNFAALNNVSELDTADAYGDAQGVLKKYFEHKNCSFKIMSKFIWDRSKDFNFHLDQSLNALGIENLEGYYFHRFDDFKNFTFFDQVEMTKKQGKIKYLGVSVYSIEELEFAINNLNVNLIQLPFNLFDRSLEKQNLLLKAKERNVLVYVRSAFLQGLFFKNINELSDSLKPLKENLIELQSLSKKLNISIEDMALGYLKTKEFIDGILIGVDSLDQLKNNLNSFDVILSKEIVEMIEAIKIERVDLLNPANWK